MILAPMFQIKFQFATCIQLPKCETYLMSHKHVYKCGQKENAPVGKLVDIEISQTLKQQLVDDWGFVNEQNKVNWTLTAKSFIFFCIFFYLFQFRWTHELRLLMNIIFRAAC